MAITINGSGTITGISAGGLPDGSVTSDDIADDAVTAAKIADDAVTADKLDVGQIGGRRNLIINGAMQVAQRGTSLAATNGTYGLDRFKIYSTSLDEHIGTMAQDTDAPNGFSNSFKITTTTAESAVASDEYFYIAQIIEAQDLQHLAFGTSDAKPITLSFWIKSSQTGVFGVSLYTQDNTGIANSTYTINAASTWEYKTITFTGDTSRAINNDNGIGMYVNFHLAAGSNFTSGTTDESFEVYTDAKWAGGHAQNGVITTASATWQITGVQLEVGDTATPFEHRSYGEELALCQRYFSSSFATSSPQNAPTDRDGNAIATIYNPYASNFAYTPTIVFPVQMRTTPTITFYRTVLSSTDGEWGYYKYGGSWQSLSATSVQQLSVAGFNAAIEGSFGSTSGILYGGYTAEAEL